MTLPKGEHMRRHIVVNQGEDHATPSSAAGQDPPYNVGAEMETLTGRTVRLTAWQKEKGLYVVMGIGKDTEIRHTWRIPPSELVPPGAWTGRR